MSERAMYVTAKEDYVTNKLPRHLSLATPRYSASAIDLERVGWRLDYQEINLSSRKQYIISRSRTTSVRTPAKISIGISNKVQLSSRI